MADQMPVPGMILSMRSKLFVPGSRPEFFAKAWRSDVDAISFDLEDAVVADRKAEARAAVAEELARAPTARGKAVLVRVNPIDSGLFEADLDAIVRPGLHVINLPKVEAAAEVLQLCTRLE